MTDWDLIVRARDGERVAFEELVRRHQVLLFRTALSIVRVSTEAEDVTQSAWLQAFRHLHRFQGASAVTTWLVAIVRNQAIDHLRVSRRRSGRELASGEPGRQPELRSSPPSPEDLAVFNEQRRCLAHCIESLPPKLRHPLLLWNSSEYSYADIAAIIGVPCGTIKSRVWEARRRVLRAFQEYDDGARRFPRTVAASALGAQRT